MPELLETKAWQEDEDDGRPRYPHLAHVFGLQLLPPLLDVRRSRLLFDFTKHGCLVELAVPVK